MSRLELLQQVSEGLDTLGTIELIDEKPKETAYDEVRRWYESHKQLQTLAQYIHTNECSDEGGWFAYIVHPDKGINESFGWSRKVGLFVNCGESEAQIVRDLILKIIVMAQIAKI